MSSVREEAIDIWRAGVNAVDPVRLVRDQIYVSKTGLSICGKEFPARAFDRVVVVGAGKAGHKMATGVEEALLDSAYYDSLCGWVNVPDDCVSELSRITLHGARAAGCNEPSERGVFGARRIVSLLQSLGSRDVCLVLISGGGSALLPAPASNISLADKLDATKKLMLSGVPIHELNAVRSNMSFLKGGRLSALCKAPILMSLIISDVVGDPISVIASGPTVSSVSSGASKKQALSILKRVSKERNVKFAQSIIAHLEASDVEDSAGVVPECVVCNRIIGSNTIALDAAAKKARELGFEVYSLGANNEGDARDEGTSLAELCLSISRNNAPVSRPACVLSGGEPVVSFVPGQKIGKGGRNLELVLAALKRFWDEEIRGIALLSGGTDGEDGPTDAAGAVLDYELRLRADCFNLDRYLEQHDSYCFFEQTRGLLITGMTGTNVMDLRVCIVR